MPCFSYLLTKCHCRYNIGVAIFIARNRVTAWGNGAAVDDEDHRNGEPWHKLTVINTIRRAASQGASETATEALTRLKDLPPYTMFPGVPSEEVVAANHAD